MEGEEVSNMRKKQRKIAKTMEVGRGDQAKVQEIPVVGRWAEMQGKPSAELGRCSGRFPEVQGGFQKCRARKARRLAEMQADIQGGWKQCRRMEAYSWQRSLAECRSREEAVNKAAQAPLVPMGSGLGHRLGFPQGRVGPRQLPTGRKVW